MIHAPARPTDPDHGQGRDFQDVGRNSKTMRQCCHYEKSNIKGRMVTSMRIKNRVLLLISNFVILSLVIGCAVTDTSRPAPSASVQPRESILRVGVSTNAPPLIYKQGQQIVGLEAELAEEFAKFLGKSVSFVELEWEDQIPALLSNRIDIIMSGMSITKMRQLRIAFSEPYFRTGQMGLIHRSSEKRMSGGYYSIYAWAIQIRFGVVKATTGEFFVKKNLSKARKISSFQTSREAVNALKYRKVDMVIHDAPIILSLAAENESEGLIALPSLLTEEYLAWGIRKNDVELLSSANTFLETLKDDGRLNIIVNRWIPFAK
jgi:polar amino acid transport system substrate-binding protein